MLKLSAKVIDIWANELRGGSGELSKVGSALHLFISDSSDIPKQSYAEPGSRFPRELSIRRSKLSITVVLLMIVGLCSKEVMTL